ncbi:putative nuclease HARBI1 [Diadema antillarum]|uniref:putative nuclease HARBI1 n=1 Tax=Diadema antillarum TaxID=105358 RepID=UPI003A85B4E4
MPNVIGAIDCTHVNIRAPKENPQVYVNRKGKHSINVQAIVNADLQFVNVVAKWPGSSHDAFIWENSNICSDLRNGRLPSGWLIGDSGYPLQPWLMTPVPHPASPAEERYNAAFARTRVSVERAFGVLKARFRCLDSSGGVLCYSPERVCKIIMSCCVLHNICMERRLPLPDVINLPHQEAPADVDPQHPNNDHHSGLQTRNNIIARFFA